jgi:hypothetical protein
MQMKKHAELEPFIPWRHFKNKMAMGKKAGNDWQKANRLVALHLH